MRTLQRECERARQWASAEIDGELSEFEAALLRAHLSCCESCGDFHREIAGLTRAVRAAPRAHLERRIEIGRARRRLRLAPAVAAMAAVAVGLGSLLASSQVPSGSVGSDAARQARSFKFDPDTLRAAQRQLLRAQAPRRTAGKAALLPTRLHSSLHGGPVLEDR